MHLDQKESNFCSALQYIFFTDGKFTRLFKLLIVKCKFPKKKSLAKFRFILKNRLLYVFILNSAFCDTTCRQKLKYIDQYLSNRLNT